MKRYVMEQMYTRRLSVLLFFVLFSFVEGISVAAVSPEDPASQSKSEAPARISSRKGMAALVKGDLDTAESAFKESLRLDPKAVPSLVGLAEVMLKRSRPKEAEELLQTALETAPQHAPVYNVWGRYLYTQKKFTEAEAAFKKAISLRPQEISSYIELGDLYLNGLQKPQEAIAVYREAVALDRHHAGAHYALGLALTTTAETDQAISELKEASRLAPTNPQPFQALGRLYAARKEYQLAFDALDMALKAQPLFVQAYLERGDIFLEKGERDRALLEYQRALKISPKFADAHVKIGLVQQQNNRPDEAEQSYQLAIELDPQQAIAYNNLAWLAAERKMKLDEGLAWAEKAIQLSPQVPFFYDTLGWVYRARKEMGLAAATLEKAVAMPPLQAEILYHLGIVYMEQGKKKEAGDAFERAFTLKQAFAGAEDARQRLANLSQP